MDIYYIHMIHTYPTLPFKQIDRPQVLYEETIMSFLVQQILGHFGHWTRTCPDLSISVPKKWTYSMK